MGQTVEIFNNSSFIFYFKAVIALELPIRTVKTKYIQKVELALF